MDTFYYYKSIRKTVIQFLDMFNSIRIAKYTKTGTVAKYITVPIKLGGKERVWYWVEEARKESEERIYEMLPLIAAEITGIEYSSTRQKNKYHMVTSSSSPGTGTATMFENPIPFDIGITLRIYSLYMAEVDQILEQILPYFQPYAQMKVYISDVDESFDAKVLFESAAPEQSFEYSQEERRNIVWTLNFKIHSLFFKPATTDDTNLIQKIITKYYLNEDAWNDYQGTETMYTSGASGVNTHEAESIFIKGVSPWLDDDGDIVCEMERFGNNEE